ncbi:MAG: hypothetical protein HGA67_01395 [Candidatus Yonathbacteria bacterium]|nr:hypothetical protein [Candidatus Yonathbacteria bacterium]
MPNHEHPQTEETISACTVRFTPEDALRLFEMCDTITNTGGEEGRRLVETVTLAARNFVDCIREIALLDATDVTPGTPWHKRETALHNAFEESLRAITDAGYTLPIDMNTLNHKNSNTLAVLLVAEEARRRHIVTT